MFCAILFLLAFISLSYKTSPEQMPPFVVPLVFVSMANLFLNLWSISKLVTSFLLA
ncbi:hypothetical protein [Spiroplasma endosymbiont of Melieria omissa]|uniref:hypothetical protein n=1 Tax=Spiroplasma endosymbiont of Melieria omissa TaxID=3139324 RepID=UPI003CCAA752